MDSYYANQANSMPLFHGNYRQRSSGIGALPAGIGRYALPLARRFVLPTAKLIGRELLKKSVPELLDVVSSKKSPKQALKNTISNTVKKHGGSWKKQLRQRRLRSCSKSPCKMSSAETKRKKIISSWRPMKRSRSDFFAKVNDDR